MSNFWVILFEKCFGRVAFLVIRSDVNGLILFETTTGQTTETMPLALKQ